MTLADLRRAGLVRPCRAERAAPSSFPFGLGAEGVHELVETAPGDHPALLGFALAAAAAHRPKRIFWVGERLRRRDYGAVLQSELERGFGAPVLCLQAAPRRTADALWCVEEAIRSGAIDLVVAEVSDLSFTASRRLLLASAQARTPALLVLPHSRRAATAAGARWRIAPLPSAQNPFDPKGLGRPRWRAVLERCRTAPDQAGRAFDVEYDDETLRLGVVSGLVDRTAAPDPPRRAGDVRQSAQRRAG